MEKGKYNSLRDIQMFSTLLNKIFFDKNCNRIIGKISCYDVGGDTFGGDSGGGDSGSDAAGPGHGMSEAEFAGFDPADVSTHESQESFGSRFSSALSNIKSKVKKVDPVFQLAMSAIIPGAGIAVGAGILLSSLAEALGISSSAESAATQAAMTAESEGSDAMESQMIGETAYKQAISNAIAANPAANITQEQANQYMSNLSSPGGTDSINKAMDNLNSVSTDIEYTHTLADLSGIQMDATEKALIDSQKQIAIDRAITEIEDTYADEGEHMIAQQVYNLGENALSGTIGRDFFNRWQEREAKTKAGALQDIESTYLAAERQGIDTQKQRQIDLWGKEYESDVRSAELGLEKAKSSAALEYDWGKTTRGQDISVQQAELDRLLSERMGTRDYEAWEEANKWQAAGGIAGAVAGSDWFGETIKDWF